MSALLIKLNQFINSIYSGIILILLEHFRSESVYMKIQLLCVRTEFQTYSFESKITDSDIMNKFILFEKFLVLNKRIFI
jgi:hypothetical protein